MDQKPALPPPLDSNAVNKTKKRIALTQTLPPEHEIDDGSDLPTPKPDRKRKARPEESNESVAGPENVNTGEVPSKRRKRQQSKYSRDNLAPFDFFLVQPPVVFAPFYSQLCEWMGARFAFMWLLQLTANTVAIVNKDISLAESPFVLDPSCLPLLTKGTQ